VSFTTHRLLAYQVLSTDDAFKVFFVLSLEAIILAEVISILGSGLREIERLEALLKVVLYFVRFILPIWQVNRVHWEGSDSCRPRCRQLYEIAAFLGIVLPLLAEHVLGSVPFSPLKAPFHLGRAVANSMIILILTVAGTIRREKCGVLLGVRSP
jgi:hypothetical protein